MWLVFLYFLVTDLARRRKPAMSNQPQSPRREHYFEGPDMTPEMRTFLLAQVRAFKPSTSAQSARKREAERLLLTATRVDLPLPKDGLAAEIEAAEEEAERRGPKWSAADILIERMEKAA